jgi:long-chain acyl-CoA synthetase
MGMRCLYMPRFDASRFLRAVEEDQPMAVFIVPAMAQLLIADPRFEDADLSSIVMCSLGSAPLAPSTLRRLQEKMPNATVSNAYGMTEAGPAYCAMPKEESLKRMGSVGQPMPPMEVRAVDEQGETLPPGEVGEILIRLPGREREYYKDEEATARTWSGGWLHSGDLGYLDEDGFLFILGRADDVLVLDNGRKVIVRPIEERLRAGAAIEECVVFCPSQTHLVAVVSPAGEPADEAAIAEQVARANAALTPDEQVAKVVVADRFSIENGLLTSQFKPRRKRILDRYRAQVNAPVRQGTTS